MVLGLRLPAPRSDAWAWAGRLLLVVAGTAAAWFLLLVVSGQARAATTPPGLPCVASSVADAHHAASAVADSVADPSVPVECAVPPLDTEQGTPAAAAPGGPGMAAPPVALDDLLTVPALDRPSRTNSAGPAAPSADVGNHGSAVVAELIAVGQIPETAGQAPAETPGLPLMEAPDVPGKAPSARTVPLSRTTAEAAHRPVAHRARPDSDVVAEQQGGPSVPVLRWVPPSASVPTGSAARPATSSQPPGDVGLPPLSPLPAPPAPCAGASTVTVPGSGGSDRFDALSTLGSPDFSVAPPGSTGVAPSSDGHAIRAQARPEPRPD